MSTTKTLEQLRNDIERESAWVGLKPYSHNIVSLCLSMISQRHGIEEANKAIEDFDLESLGWHKEKP